MNRRTFTASLAGMLGVVGLGAKAKAAPKPTGRTLNARGPVTLGAESNNFDTVNIYPGGSVSFEGGPKIKMHSPTGSVTMRPAKIVSRPYLSSWQAPLGPSPRIDYD